MVAATKPLIFISHAIEDRGIASLIKDAIQNRHKGVFEVFSASDPESIQAGDEWKKDIEEAIGGSALMLVLLTENSRSSPWIYWECGGAYYHTPRTPVMPLLGPRQSIPGLQTLFPDFQAVDLCEARGLCTMMERIDRLPGGSARRAFDPGPLLRKLEDRFAAQELTGKDWLEKAMPRIREFLKSIGRGQATIRIISYTDETTSDRLPAEILAHLGRESILNLRILLRSEYSGLTSRPLEADSDYNRQVRRRTSQFKARWYRCAKKLKARDEENTLSIRGYDFDPMPKSLILGETDGYFGLYAIDRKHSLSEHPEIGPALDWVAGKTSMAHVDRSQASFLTSLVRWFDSTWDQATQRSNEQYRYERFDRLWSLLKQKCEAEPQVREVISEWGRTREKKRPDVGNLAIPRSRPETPKPVIDVIACAVRRRETNEYAMICEIRGKEDVWEGIGKTETYLDLIGLAPAVPLIRPDEFRIASGRWENRLLRRIRESEFRWEEKGKYDFEFVASDFVWISMHRGKLTICPPEGEPAIALWDVSRHVLRRMVGDLKHWQDGIQRALLTHQELLFRKITLGELEGRHYQSSEPIMPSLVVVLQKATGCTSPNTQVVESPEEISGLLDRVLKSGPNHRSPFWQRLPDEILRLREAAEELVKSVDREALPKVVLVTGSPPFGSMASIVCKHLK